MALPDKFHLCVTNKASTFTLTSSRTVDTDYPITNLQSQQSGLFSAFDMTAQTALNIYGTNATAWDINCLSLHNHTISNGTWRVRLYADASQAGTLIYDSASEVYALFDGTNDNSTTSDTATNSITGDFTAIARISTDALPSGGVDLIFWKWDGAPNLSFICYINGTGFPAIGLSADGTTDAYINSSASLQSAGISAGDKFWIKFDLDVNNGASGKTAYFRYSLQNVDDPADVVWSLLSQVTTAGTTSIYDSTSSLSVGATSGGLDAFDGKIYRAIFKSGIDGTTVSDFDPRRWTSGTTFGSSVSGETWTLNNGASIVVTADTIEHPYATTNNWKANLSMWFDSVAAKSFQIDVTVAGAINDTILIDKLFLGEALTIEAGQGRESSVTVEDASIQHRKADGGVHTVEFPAVRKALLDLPIVENTEMETIRTALRTAKKGNDVLFTMDPNDGFAFKEDSTSVYRVSSDRSLMSDFYNNNPTRISLTEN